MKLLLQQQHLQTYGTFRREYDKTARALDADLEGTAPSKAQLYRWLSGNLRGLPYPHHCRVLEKMFPGWTAAQLFEHCAAADTAAEASRAQVAQLFEVIDAGLSAPAAAAAEWAAPESGSHDPRSGFAETGRGALPVAVSTHAAPQTSTATKELGQRLLALAKVKRLPHTDLEQLARLAGNIVELDLTVEIDIAGDGRAVLAYRHELLNMSGKPLTKLARELWFENTTGPLVITPRSEADHRIAIQRVHDTRNMVKFACLISPAIRPGEAGVVSYTCEGGQFLYDHYWREASRRHTRHFTLRLRHRGGGNLSVCTAIEEHPDGSENSATEDLMWDYEDDDVVITLTRDHLIPNQAVTLRWAVANEPA